MNRVALGTRSRGLKEIFNRAPTLSALFIENDHFFV